MTHEKEQLDDLKWAGDVLAGRGSEDDSERGARDMLSMLFFLGVTKEIRQSALMTLITNGERIA